MAVFENVDLKFHPNTINEIEENQSLVIGDLHGNSLKLIWTLVQSGVMEIDEQEYEDLARIYQLPAEQLTSEDIHQFNSIIAGANINPCHLNLIGDELCDRGANDYFTLIILNKLKQEKMPVEIMMSNHSIEFLKNYQNGTLRDIDSLIPGSDTSLRGLSTLLTNNIITEAEVNYLVENAYKPNLRLLSHSHDEEGNQTLYVHAPSALETVRSLARKFNIDYDGSQQNFAACINAINQHFHDNFDAEVSTLIDTMNALQDENGVVLGEHPISTDYPMVRLLWHRVRSISDIAELDLPEWLKEVIHGHEGDVRLSLQEINHSNAQNPTFEAIFIDENNPAQSYHEKMTNLDNDLGKRELTGSYHYHTNTETISTFSREPIENLNETLPSRIERFAYQLISNLKSGNNILLEEQQVIWNRINDGEYDYTENLIEALYQIEFNDAQAQLVLALIFDKEGSVKEVIDDVLKDRFNIEINEDYFQSLSLQLCNRLNDFIFTIQDDKEKRQFLFKTNEILNKILSIVNLIDSHLDNDQKEMMIGLIQSAIENQHVIVQIQRKLQLFYSLLESVNQSEQQFASYLIHHCTSINQFSIANDFIRLNDEQKQAVINELYFREESDEVDLDDNFNTHVKQIVTRFKNQERVNNRNAILRNYLSVNPITYAYAKVESHTSIISDLESGSDQLIAKKLANKVHEYCQELELETIFLNELEDSYEHIKTLLRGPKANLKNLETDITDDLDLGEKLKRIINQNVTVMFNQHATARDNLNALARKIFRVGENDDTSNPYGLSFFSRIQCHYIYSEQQEENNEEQTNNTTVKLSNTMKKMMEWIRLVRQGKATAEYAQYQIAKLGKEACQKHNITEEDVSAKGQLYLFASKIQTNNAGWQLKQNLCEDYCKAIREKIKSTRWDIKAPGGNIIENNRLSFTMQQILKDIQKAEEGRVDWSAVYINIKRNAARATCRHANEGKMNSRHDDKTAPYALYSEIATSNILAFSHKEAAITLEAIKRDMDEIIENPDIQKKILGFVIGGTARVLDKYNHALGQSNSKRRIPKNLAKMYDIYALYKKNEAQPVCALQALNEIMLVAQKASVNEHWLRRSELQRFYKKVAKDEYAISENLITPHH